mmetsp:Transcript_13810/g.21045  ORF Transcript_13810/g.21045 Transcript_13810/m.21045 type:complete len:251 (+) Transcript_13810:203-955(+)
MRRVGYEAVRPIEPLCGVVSTKVDEIPRYPVLLQKKRRLCYEITADKNMNPLHLRKKRRVQFKEKVTFHHSPYQKYQTEHKSLSNNLWETREELEKMRSRAKSLSAEIASKSFNIKTENQHLSYHSVLTRIYRRALSSSRSGLKEVDDFNSHIDDQKGLYIWVQHGNSRRGLERWSVPSMGNHRNDQRALLVSRLLSVQHAFPAVSTRTLSEVSKQFSESAKVFALAMGKADEFAAMAEHGFTSKGENLT